MISWLSLNMVEGLKPIHRAALLREFGTAEAIFRMSEMDLSALPEIRADLAYRIVHFDLRLAEEELQRTERAGVKVLTLADKMYPPLLKTIPDPPVVLYVRGTLLPDEPTVALVGSRKATPYGLNATQYLAEDLGKAGVTVVSGLARGIDARAHKAALQTGSRTIAVLGSGVDVIYPSEHQQLARKIAEQGAVVSEFPLGTSPNRENFPVRNRIISGLSYVIVVVEASDKSGSLITARTASEQGREILAVPGSIFNDSSKGCHALLKDGAALARNWKDIVAELPSEVADKLKIQEATEEKPALTDVEQSLIGFLSFDQPKNVDQLVGLAGIQSKELLGALVSLELKNYISQMPGKQFIRVK